MPLHKSRFKYFIEGRPVEIPLAQYPHVAPKCGSCGHNIALGYDMTPDTNDPRKKRYVEARCEKCGAPWWVHPQGEKADEKRNENL